MKTPLASTGVRNVTLHPDGFYMVRVQRRGRAVQVNTWESLDTAARIAAQLRRKLGPPAVPYPGSAGR